jgi:hypothetical protein
MENYNGCQLPCLPNMSVGEIIFERQSLIHRLKRMLARPWNYHVKRYLKRAYTYFTGLRYRLPGSSYPGVVAAAPPMVDLLAAGDFVRVKSQEEIQATLNPWKELKGCAFLEDMWQYCGTTQRVLKPVERFLDERDYKVKKAKGVILLQDVLCHGTPVFGRCDRGCHLFWRAEWLEKIGGNDSERTDDRMI